MTDTIEGFDPYMTAILANRVDGIIREMTNTLLRAARSGVINSARDFSCSICTGDNQLLASAEGLPIHIFGSHMQARTMTENAGATLREGDCYLHNDPYSGNSHAGDHAFLVPVFVDGEHMFTTVAKAHQADIGNSLPTTYMAGARDQYEEGALIFPAVKIQSNYEMVDDVVRMCRSRIRVPDQWYGDFLAGIGSARIGERRLKELCDKYGKATIKAFIQHWMTYAEQRMVAAIKTLPAVRLHNSGNHDPFGTLLPDGIPLQVSLTIDPDTGYIDVDLRDNGDTVACGFNQSEACAGASVMAGIFNSIDADVPRNSGSFSRIRLHIRKGSVCGGAVFPSSCSLATTNVSDRMVNIVQAAFAQIGDGWGLAEGGVGMGAGCAVVSGRDPRLGDSPFVNQLFLTNSGGPASAMADGWVTYGLPVAAGLMYRDSVEIDELKHPMDVQYVRLIPGTGGAGRFRGAPSMETGYISRCTRMEAIWPCDGTHFPAKGARGGLPGASAEHRLVRLDGTIEPLPNIVVLTLKEGEMVEGRHAAGGGYGHPHERDPRRVLHDVLEGWETLERAGSIYGVSLSGRIDDDSLALDVAGTAERRGRTAA
ncbi:hydantoinase B/oxoprolinase family protein [Lichenihabitans sp. PAMC28606]|uniref:hydantoinase B/oxoprolinase family protein n=1 Tax=Lichenihabitans sp. PAMC28606 TaxID=2880932 RepID=UPI001D0B81C4|nr:hydantoinase B/oxoprolinase family protein [Lichenihabitans sp. PAMC28606]UDL93935.1 hydantoinase B/oxoprolinase family protein [Lichenihabitans sp. PAMC28606]